MSERTHCWKCLKELDKLSPEQFTATKVTVYGKSDLQILCDVDVAQRLSVNTNHYNHKWQLIPDDVFINMHQVEGERKVQAVQFWGGCDQRARVRGALCFDSLKISCDAPGKTSTGNVMWTRKRNDSSC